MSKKNAEIFSIYIQSLMLHNNCADDYEKFGKTIGVSGACVYCWVNGRQVPSAKSLKKLQRAGADVDYILELVGGCVKDA